MTDWIEWSGGYCPLPRYVEVRYRDGSEQRLLIGSISDHSDWLHIASDPSGDIVAYRLVPPTLSRSSENRNG